MHRLPLTKLPPLRRAHLCPRAGPREKELPSAERARLLAWINLHDCGVVPTAVDRGEAGIEVRVLCAAADGADFCEIEMVSNYLEARDALGY